MSSNERNAAFLQQFKMLLDKHKMKEVESLFADNLIAMCDDSELMWDIVPIICFRLKTLNEFRFKTFASCQQMLLRLTTVCKPKEILIALLAELENENMEMNEEHLDDSNSNETLKKYQSKDNCFKAIMKPLQNILVKLPKKRNETLKWVLNTLNSHLLKIPLPRDYQLNTGKERLLLENDPTVRRFNTLLPCYLEFLTTFVEELKPEVITCGLYVDKYIKDVPQRDILLTTLLSLLFHPFAFLDLSIRINDEVCNNLGQQKTKTNSKSAIKLETEVKQNNCKINNVANIRCISGSVMNMTPKPSLNSFGTTARTNDFSDSLIWSVKTIELISKLEPNMFNIYERREELTEVKDFKMSAEALNYALGTQAYLTFCLNLSPTRSYVPAVYSHLYVFRTHLPFINSLIERKECFLCEKGLMLSEKLISALGCLCLDSSFLDCLKQHPLDKTLIKIMRLSSVKAHRQQALRVFTFLIYSFTNYGRYQIIYTIIAEPRQHSGVKGFVLGLYKDLIAKENDISVFIGLNLHRIVRKAIACCLPDNTETDLLENSDSILGLLSLIRFLLLRDRKEKNETLIWNIVDTIDNDLLKPLRKAVYLSRTHYKLELKMKEEKGKPRKNEPGFAFEVFAANSGDDKELIPNLPVDHERQVIKLALSHFDIIESVVVRIDDIINEYKI